MKKKNIVTIILGLLLTGSTIVCADNFSETVEFGARWNHGSCVGSWGTKASYSDLGKWGHKKEARASINGKETKVCVNGKNEWALAKQNGGWWDQLATAGYDIWENEE